MCQTNLASEVFSAASEDSTSDSNGQDTSKPNGSSKMNHTLKQSYENTGLTPKFMMTLRASILKTYQESMYSPEDSLVKTSAMLESELALRGVVLHSGNITCEPLAKYDQSSQSLRTFQHSLDEDSTLFSQTLPRSGMMRNGIVYQLPALVHLTAATGYSSLPTPTVSDATTGAIIGKNDQFYMTKTGMPRKINQNGKDGSVGLGRLVQMWPTPTKGDLKRGVNSNMITKENGRYVRTSKTTGTKFGASLGMALAYENQGIKVTGSLNPGWVEWLMGFPIGFTELNDWVMPSSRKYRKQLVKQL